MGTEFSPDISGPPEDVDPEIAAIQESLLVEDAVDTEQPGDEQQTAEDSEGGPVPAADASAGLEFSALEETVSVPEGADIATAEPEPTRALGPGGEQLALPAMVEEAEGVEAPKVAGFEAGTVPLRSILLPFVIYDIVWATFAFALARLLVDLPSGKPVYEWLYYEYAVWVGVALTALGPLLILAVWLVTKLRNRESNGVGIATLLIGSAATLLGAVLWWGALIIVDYVRLGSVY